MAEKIKTLSVPRLMRENKGRIFGTLNFEDAIGRMFFYVYDPKHKATLPYYDKFPLVMPIAFKPDGWIGLNFHYLAPPQRAVLMNALYDVMNNQKLNHTTRIEITYGLLKSASKYKLFKPCLKRYLASHVRSGFLYVGPDEWDAALLLPAARFAKMNQAGVWKESEIIANGGDPSKGRRRVHRKKM